LESHGVKKSKLWDMNAIHYFNCILFSAATAIAALGSVARERSAADEEIAFLPL
jgi:hypothetical protein